MNDKRYQYPVQLDKDFHRELQIAATLKSDSMVNVLRDAFFDYKIKQRIEDRIKEFSR